MLNLKIKAILLLFNRLHENILKIELFLTDVGKIKATIVENIHKIFIFFMLLPFSAGVVIYDVNYETKDYCIVL